MKRRMVVTGNAQAEIVAEILGAVDGIQTHYDVVYLERADAGVKDTDVLCVQQSDTGPDSKSERKAHRVIRFPQLSFEVLWPLNCVNSYNKTEPGFAHGRFPYGDSYVLNCVRTNTDPQEILAFCAAVNWPENWPNLDRLFQSESARMMLLDAKCDVKIASYILKRFRTKRLFHNPNAPSNELLNELALRIARVVAPEASQTPTDSSRSEMLATIEVPIHRAIAAHFNLEWFTSELRYNHFDEVPISSDEYFRRLIASSYREKFAATQTLVIYGNCQAQALASIVERAGLDSLRVLYLRSFDEPGAEPAELSIMDVVRCGLLWEQHDDQHPFPYREWLPPNCRTVRFPAVDFNALWPFTCVNPDVRPKPPKYPFGQFPYGDRVTLDCLEETTGVDEAWNCYTRIAQERLPDLDRFLALEFARLSARDAKCDVKMAQYIVDNFPRRRLFWTVNHPSSALLAELARRLLAASHTFGGLRAVNPERILADHFDLAGPLGVTSVPIHPAVASHYRLEWYIAGDELFQNWGDAYTYEGYFLALMADSHESRTLRKTHEATQQG